MKWDKILVGVVKEAGSAVILGLLKKFNEEVDRQARPKKAKRSKKKKGVTKSKGGGTP